MNSRTALLVLGTLVLSRSMSADSSVKLRADSRAVKSASEFAYGGQQTGIIFFERIINR